MNELDRTVKEFVLKVILFKFEKKKFKRDKAHAVM